MRKINIFFVTIFAFLCFYSCNKNELKAQVKESDKQEIRENFEEKLQQKADSALVYIKENKLNPNYAILVDMSIHSGKYRFFVWDFKNKETVHSSLCAHGYGKGSTQDVPVFSNQEGSYCSSLGKYKLGIRSHSKWGINIHYKLHGLEKTNSNAYKRIVVLHSFDPVSSEEIYPNHLPLGWSQGCPVVDNETMRYLDKLLSKEKDVLFWIYK